MSNAWRPQRRASGQADTPTRSPPRTITRLSVELAEDRARLRTRHSACHAGGAGGRMPGSHGTLGRGLRGFQPRLFVALRARSQRGALSIVAHELDGRARLARCQAVVAELFVAFRSSRLTRSRRCCATRAHNNAA